MTLPPKILIFGQQCPYIRYFRLSAKCFCFAKELGVSSQEQAPDFYNSLKQVVANREDKTKKALIIIGFPLWFPLLIAALAVVLAVYVSIWSVIISLWAAFASVTACSFSGIVVGIGFIITKNITSGVALIGAGLVLAGLSIFLFFGCKAATNGTIYLTKKMVLSVKNSFIKKEATK